MPTTWNAIYLGIVSTALDPIEGNTTAENAGTTGANGFVGRTFGSAANPLHDRIYSVQTVNNAAPNDVLNQNSNLGNDQIRVDLDRNLTAETYTFDASSIYNTTVTFFDGSTQNLALTIFQTTTGQTFMAPSVSAATNTTLGNQAITSIRLNSVVANNTSGLIIERPVVEFACFAAGVMIDTPRGQVAVETLSVGDLVLNVDHDAQPVKWVGAADIDLAMAPNLRPVRIKAGALGADMPVQDLLVSPQHRVLVRSKIAQRMFGTDEVLIAAKQLLVLDGVSIADDLNSVTYVHFLFDEHQVVYSNGAQTESLFTGPEALKNVGPSARAEIIAIFPELAADDVQATPVHHLPLGREARKMAERHQRNRAELVS